MVKIAQGDTNMFSVDANERQIS